MNNNHKVSRDNPGRFFLGNSYCFYQTLLCGTIFRHLTKLKAQNGLKRYHRTQWQENTANQD